jgi:hypothetical protein
MTIRSYQFQVTALVPGATTVTRTATTDLSVELQSIADPGPVIKKDATTELGLTQDAAWLSFPGGVSVVTQDLNLTQLADWEGNQRVVTELGLTQVADAQYPIVLEAIQSLALISTATGRIGVINKSPTTNLNLSSTANVAIDANPVTNLNLEQRASFTDIFQDIGLTQTAEWGYGYDAFNDLGLVQLASRILGLGRGAVHDIGLEQAVAYFIESPCSKKQFESWHGLGGVAPADKKLNYTNEFTLVSLDDGTLITLRNPETDDRRRYAFDRVNRSFFDGTADVFAADDWVTEETQIYTIIATKKVDVEQVFQFLQDNLGREVLIKDWKGVSWIVIITNPGELYTEDGEGVWTIDFEVVGESVEGEYVVQRLDLTMDPSRAGSIYGRLGLSTDILSSRAFPQPLPLETPLGITNTATFTIE